MAEESGIVPSEHYRVVVDGHELFVVEAIAPLGDGHRWLCRHINDSEDTAFELAACVLQPIGPRDC